MDACKPLINISDMCDDMTCEHGGTCTHAIDGPHCQCNMGFQGDTCEIGMLFK